MNRIAEALDIVRRAKALGDYDSNVIGMAAEIIGEERFGMSKASPCTRTVDGYRRNGNSTESVQVKGWSCSRVSTYRNGTFFRIPAENGPDALLVVLFYSHIAEYEVLYFGEAARVGVVERNGKKRTIRLDALQSREQIARILEKIRRSRPMGSIASGQASQGGINPPPSCGSTATAD
jgi:hypothetical protein